jgi:hypothetical protein
MRDQQQPKLKLTAPPRRPLREFPLQKQIADVLRREIASEGRVSARGVVWFAVDVAMFFGAIPGAGRGIIEGLPDLWFLYAGRAYLIELKAPGGALSEAQKAFIAAGLCSAVHVGIACSLEQVLALLDSWGVPRAQRIRIAA